MARDAGVVGERLRALRRRHGVTARELAGRIGVSAATLSAIENGHTRLTVQRAGEIARALGVDPAVLVADRLGPAPAPAVRRPEAVPGAAPSGSVAGGSVAGRGHWRDFPPLPMDPVVAGAVRVFVATGYHGATIREIAESAGRSVPGVYHHYPSKHAILERVLELTMADLQWRLEQARDGESTPLGRVEAVVEALALYHACRSDLAFIGASEMRSLEPAAYARIARLRNAVQQLLDAEIDAALVAGELTTAHPRDAGRAIATMCTSLAQWFRPDGPTPAALIAREYAGFALGLLGAVPRDR